MTEIVNVASVNVGKLSENVDKCRKMLLSTVRWEGGSSDRPERNRHHRGLNMHHIGLNRPPRPKNGENKIGPKMRFLAGPPTPNPVIFVISCQMGIDRERRKIDGKFDGILGKWGEIAN